MIRPGQTIKALHPYKDGGRDAVVERVFTNQRTQERYYVVHFPPETDKRYILTEDKCKEIPDVPIS